MTAIDEAVALRATGEELLAQARNSASGRAASTVVAVPGLRVTLLALAAGQGLAEHESPGAATLTCLSGRLRLATADAEALLDEHDIVPIPPARHSLTAETDALALLTVRQD